MAAYQMASVTGGALKAIAIASSVALTMFKAIIK